MSFLRLQNTKSIFKGPHYFYILAMKLWSMEFKKYSLQYDQKISNA